MCLWVFTTEWGSNWKEFQWKVHASLVSLEFELFSCMFAIHHDQPMTELVTPVLREYFLCNTMDWLTEDLKGVLNNIQIFKYILVFCSHGQIEDRLPVWQETV